MSARHVADPAMREPGDWLPTAVGGRHRRWWRNLGLVLASLGGAGLLGMAVLAVVFTRTAEANIERIPLASLDIAEPGKPLNLLVVGSDSREGLTREERLRYTVGLEDVGGQRSDTVILVSILPQGRGVNIVSFPRDLLVVYEDDRYKLTEVFVDGPEALTQVVQQNFGVPVHHYVEVSILGFLGTVETLGSVQLCLDEPLRDRKSGADLPAGCQRLDPREALSYVRSRQGARGDFERIERQQRFLKAMLQELVSTRVLTDVPKLLNVVEEAASNVTLDEELSVNDLRVIAQDLRGLATGDIPMTFVPGYTQDVGGKNFVLPYVPGARALFDTVDAGEILAPRGSAEERAATQVAVWTPASLGPAGAVVRNTLHWTGFAGYADGRGPFEQGPTTTVYELPGFAQQARWVAATLGARLEALPPDVTAPEGAEVVVVVGADASA